MKMKKKQHDVAAANPKGAPCRKKKCSSDKHKTNHSNNEKPKRRRRCNNPRPRPPPPIIPEARLVQEPSDCALISDSDHEDDKIDYYRRDDETEERLLQESIRRHTRVFSYRRNPEFFNLVYHNGNDFSDEEY